MAPRWYALPLVAALHGCAVAPAPPATALPWHDAAFAAGASFQLPATDDLFRLDPALERMLDDPGLRRLDALARARYLLTLIFGEKRDGFAYNAGNSTVAADTWRARRGDCLSLTILAYSAARRLGLDAVVQEVQTAALYDRRGGFEFVNHHVNLRIRIPGRSALEEYLSPRRLIVDFDPDVVQGLSGTTLSEQEVLARFQSNLGAEALARGDHARAYAFFRAALRADPRHAPTYANLASLYEDRGFRADAETLLRHAIAVAARPEIPMSALHRQLVAEGRQQEAAVLLEQLREWQESDPYYWISTGTRALAEGRTQQAVAALEKAQSLTSGFSEVHRILAMAYWQAGRKSQAREQLALLAAVEEGNPVVAKLRRKFEAH